MREKRSANDTNHDISPSHCRVKTLKQINVFSSSSAPPRGLLVNVIGGTDADRIAWLSLIPSALSSSVANNYALSSPVTTLDAPFETMEVDLSGEEVESSRSLLESIVSGEEVSLLLNK